MIKGIGIDILDISRFEKKLITGGVSFLNQHFSINERKDLSPSHLAGIFSAKEAIFKTGFLDKLDFLSIQILNGKKGKPGVYGLNGRKLHEVIISLSHSTNVVVSIAIWQEKNTK